MRCLVVSDGPRLAASILLDAESKSAVGGGPSISLCSAIACPQYTGGLRARKFRGWQSEGPPRGAHSAGGPGAAHSTSLSCYKGLHVPERPWVCCQRPTDGAA